jgi:hypothetical protein
MDQVDLDLLQIGGSTAGYFSVLTVQALHTWTAYLATDSGESWPAWSSVTGGRNQP